MILFRYVVSLFPYFTWVMLIITLSTIAVQFYELYININTINPRYVWFSDVVFIVATLLELVLKVQRLHAPSASLLSLSLHQCRY